MGDGTAGPVSLRLLTTESTARGQEGRPEARPLCSPPGPISAYAFRRRQCRTPTPINPLPRRRRLVGSGTGSGARNE
jgi:hypothetical protein